MATSFCQHDIKNRSHFAQNRSNFLARFRSQANTCSNSVPTASLAGVRTLCQQQNQGRCWHQKRSNSAPQCSNVRTKTLGVMHLAGIRPRHPHPVARMRWCSPQVVRGPQPAPGPGHRAAANPARRRHSVAATTDALGGRVCVCVLSERVVTPVPALRRAAKGRRVGHGGGGGERQR